MAMAATRWCFVAFSLLLALNLLHEARAVISGPKDNGLIEPVEIELREGEQLSDVGRRARKPRLHKRQSEENSTDHIGTTFALHGDNHNHGLVHWTGHPSEDIFMLTRRRDRSGHSTESWLWRSTNYGLTFENETYKVFNVSNDSAVLDWYYISPNNNILIFTDLIHHRIYVTEDEGDTYNGYDIPFRPDTLRFQSSNAPRSENGSLPEHVLGFDSSDRSLWVARDLGRSGISSWTRLGRDVIRYSWRVLDTDIEANTTVYFEQAVNSTHSRLFVAESPYTNVAEFSDAIGIFERNTFVLTHEYMFVQKNISTNAHQYSSPLWVSRNRGPFNQAQFPLQKQEKHYSVVDASEGEVFIAVYHNFNNTNLYLSEEEGLKYSLSLEYIISPPESQWIGGYPTFDVHVVEGIVGTYIANRRVPTSDFGATVISFDKGGEWNLLTPPAVNRDGDPIVCPQPNCSLHLHMESDTTLGYESILSQDSAVGLIMALGNTGPTLNTDTSALRVYFSHNGGFTWQEVEEYFWEFEFASQGSIIVMVPKRRGPTNQIKWSCDEGANINSTTFSEIEIQVVAMFTERGEKARHATIFGYQGPGFKEWLVIDLDFSTVVPNQCLPEEYYIWVPTDERPGSRCLLGEVVEYERREPDHCCYIDPSYEKPTNKHPCTCAIEDFECDFGFERVNLNSPCTPMPGIVWPPAPPTDCPENGTYNFTSGYRKVAEDQCVIGNETYFLPIVQPCPILPPLGLYIQTDMPVIQAQMAVNFTLTQLLGSKFETEYTWVFGDGSSNVTSTGYEQSRVQPHTFSKPGDFEVTVTATNEGGVASFELPISVLDPLDEAMIMLPTLAQNGSVPSGVQLVFRSCYTTIFSTNHTGTLLYTWNFGDSNDPMELSTAIGTHIFVEEGEYRVDLTIHSPVNSKTSHETITVYQAITAQDIMIFSDGVVGDSYVHVGKAINFTVEKTHDDVVIPPDTVYMWQVHRVNTTDYNTSQDKELEYNFPALGSYEIGVVGEHNGVSVSVDKTVIAEYDIGGINVAMRQTIRYKRTTTANVTVMRDSNEPYMGTVDVMVHYNGSVLPIEDTVNIDDSNKQLMFKLESSGVLKLMFVASNDISNQPQDVTVNVARISQYGSVRFVFMSSHLPPDKYESPAWQNELRNSIIDYITKIYGVKVWQVEVLPLKELEEQERRREENILLAADTYIVPENLAEDDINLVLEAAMDLVNKSNSDEINLRVDGDTVSVDEGILNPDSVTSVVIVDTEEGKTTENKAVYLGLGLGLGVGLLLVLAFAVLMVYVTYRYHKKYSRLNVRYSRLQQSPVRFTFTQRGEMVEDDDDDMDDDDTATGLDGPLEVISTMEMEKKTSPT